VDNRCNSNGVVGPRIGNLLHNGRIRSLTPGDRHNRGCHSAHPGTPSGLVEKIASVVKLSDRALIDEQGIAGAARHVGHVKRVAVGHEGTKGAT
jgi:hypothetical protein